MLLEEVRSNRLLQQQREWQPQGQIEFCLSMKLTAQNESTARFRHC